MSGSSLPKIRMREIDVDADIQLLESMGSDTTIASAARVSRIGTTDDDGGGGSVSDGSRDAKLIKYLYTEKHTSPFEHVRLRFRVRCPIFVARQWLRHRTGSFNEISARYAEPELLFWLPSSLREQSTTDKQASSGLLSKKGFETSLYANFTRSYNEAAVSYNELISSGVSREMARAVLPVGTYTEFVWSVDLHNLLHFIRLRESGHAQEEIRVYAQKIKELIAEIVPVTLSCYEAEGDGK